MENRKMYGLYTMGILSAFLVVACLVIHIIAGPRYNVYYLILVLTILCFFFFKVLTVDESHVKVYRPLGFLFKRNTLPVNSIAKVNINIITTTGGSVGITFIDKEGKTQLSFLCQFYNFELKKLVKQLREYGIEVELTGTGSVGFE